MTQGQHPQQQVSVTVQEVIEEVRKMRGVDNLSAAEAGLVELIMFTHQAMHTAAHNKAQMINILSGNTPLGKL